VNESLKEADKSPLCEYKVVFDSIGERDEIVDELAVLEPEKVASLVKEFFGVTESDIFDDTLGVYVEVTDAVNDALTEDVDVFKAEKVENTVCVEVASGDTVALLSFENDAVGEKNAVVDPVEPSVAESVNESEFTVVRDPDAVTEFTADTVDILVI
jgi:superfamily I DNA and RNA helicase